MGQKPVSKRSSLFIQVFSLRDEVELGDIDSGGADHIAEMASNAEVDPTINRGLIRFPEPFRSRACLLGSGEKGRDPRDRANGHAGCTARADIQISFWPGGFLFHKTLGPHRPLAPQRRGPFEAQSAERIHFLENR